MPKMEYVHSISFTFVNFTCRNHSLKEWKPPESILSKQFDLAVVASFGYFIPPSVISCFKDGGINMHPSLLPKYRGPAPIHHALLNVCKYGIS